MSIVNFLLPNVYVSRANILLPMGNFVEWLTQEINQRGWNQADLSKHSGMSTGAVSKVMTLERKPGPEFCNAIARALKIPPEIVFRAAGLLPNKLDLTEDLEELVHVAQGLPPDQIQELIDLARLKLERRQQKKESRITKAPALGR